MQAHSYDDYTRTKIETFVPQARAAYVFMGVNRVEICDRLGDTSEVDLVMDETDAVIDLLLAPTLLSGCSFSDLKAKRYMNYIDKRIESVLTREQVSIVRDYPSISIS